MLEILCKKHDLWLKMAKGICKDSYLADDLVSEMYLKLSDYDSSTLLNNKYIHKTLTTLHIDHLRIESKYKDISDRFTEELKEEVEDYKLPNCITWVEKQILLLRQNHSCRDISKQYQIDFNKINRIERKAKLKIEEYLKTQKL